MIKYKEIDKPKQSGWYWVIPRSKENVPQLERPCVIYITVKGEEVRCTYPVRYILHLPDETIYFAGPIPEPRT